MIIHQMLLLSRSGDLIRVYLAQLLESDQQHLFNLGRPVTPPPHASELLQSECL
jgi:hypothetical protein